MTIDHTLKIDDNEESIKRGPQGVLFSKLLEWNVTSSHLNELRDP